MKQILKILTTFLAAIGLWAALLVGLIVIYPQIFGRFSSIGVSFQETEAPLITNITSPETRPLANGDSFLSFNGESLPDTKPQEAVPIVDIPQESYNNTQPITEYEVSSSTVITPIDPDENLNPDKSSDTTLYTRSIEQENPDTDYTKSQPTSIGTENQSINNFDTYDNSDQQQTNDNYVLNTSTMKIHYPSCNDVKKIAPENYSTSNLSIDSLKSQGYSTCGHCF